MYIIGNVILGTHLPWEGDEQRRISLLYATQEFLDRSGLDCSLEDLQADAEDGDTDFWLESEPWHREYHGSADDAVAWVGVQLGEFDVTNHFPLSDLDFQPSPDQLARAREAYELIPEAVRAALPPFGVYVVWSSS